MEATSSEALWNESPVSLGQAKRVWIPPGPQRALSPNRGIMTKTTKVLLLSAFTMAIWAVAGGAVAFVFGLSRSHELAAWLIGVACGALHSAQVICEFKVNRSIGGPTEVLK